LGRRGAVYKHISIIEKKLLPLFQGKVDSFAIANEDGRVAERRLNFNFRECGA